MRLEVGGHVIEALSIGGIETCYEIGALDLCLDIGRCPPGAERRRTLLLTHAHIDHAGGLPYYVSLRSLQGHKIPRVFCPKRVAPQIETMLEAWSALDADSTRCELQGVGAGDRIPLKNGWFARVFASPHRVATVGYALYRTVRKLHPDLSGWSQQAIADRARAGETVHIQKEIPEICFPGDTRIEVVDAEPVVTQARVLLLECTFCGPQVSVEKARKAGHVHLDQIAERADLFKNEVVVLTHFSRRHSREEIHREVDRRLPATLRDRVQLVLHD
jgi:ribonuclease Z